jgi:hypothetical protein
MFAACKATRLLLTFAGLLFSATIYHATHAPQDGESKIMSKTESVKLRCNISDSNASGETSL